MHLFSNPSSVDAPMRAALDIEAVLAGRNEKVYRDQGSTIPATTGSFDKRNRAGGKKNGARIASCPVLARLIRASGEGAPT